MTSVMSLNRCVKLSRDSVSFSMCWSPNTESIAKKKASRIFWCRYKWVAFLSRRDALGMNLTWNIASCLEHGHVDQDDYQQMSWSKIWLAPCQSSNEEALFLGCKIIMEKDLPIVGTPGFRWAESGLSGFRLRTTVTGPGRSSSNKLWGRFEQSPYFLTSEGFPTQMANGLLLSRFFIVYSLWMPSLTSAHAPMPASQKSSCYCRTVA